MASLIVPIHTRWGDMDIFEHINNVAYVRYLEDARAYFLESIGRKALDENYGHIVVRNEVDYVWQMEYRIEPYPMELWIGKIGSSSYVIHCELRDDTQVYMRAQTTMVCMDMKTNRPTRLPTEYREILEKSQRN